MNRILVPLFAAAAVLALIGGYWWLSGSGSSEVSEGVPASGGGTSGSTGSVEPGSPGTGSPDMGASEPAQPDPDKQPSTSGPTAVVIDSFYRYGARRLAINYTIGVPECYGTIDEPVVEETGTAVTVTLTRIPPKHDEDIACIEIALLKSVDIRLASPLAGREVLDGSFTPPQPVRRTPAAPGP